MQGFYAVYRGVFETIAEQDHEYVDDEDFQCPGFGDSLSSYEEVCLRPLLSNRFFFVNSTPSILPNRLNIGLSDLNLIAETFTWLVHCQSALAILILRDYCV